jgi:hypothetical protein
MITGELKSQVDQIWTGGISKALNNMTISKMMLGLPTKRFLNMFVKQVQAIELQKAQAERSFSTVKDFFNSLFQRALKGELI